MKKSIKIIAILFGLCIFLLISLMYVLNINNDVKDEYVNYEYNTVVISNENNNIVENNVVLENNTVSENVIITEETHATVRKLVQTYINEYKYFENNRVGTFPEILEKLNLETEENLNKLMEDNRNNYEDFKTNVKYEDFKEAMLKMITEEYFNQNFSNYINRDGFVCVNNGAGGIIAIELEDIEFVSYDANSNTYLYNAKIKDLEAYYIYSEEEDSETTLEECYFYNEIRVKNVNNNMVIDSISYK